MMQPPQHTKNKPRHYDVEVLTSEDLWSKYGSKLPEHAPGPAGIALQPSASHRWGVYGAGALFTGVLHTLLVGTMLLGTAGRPLSKPTPLTEGAATRDQNDNATEFVSVLLLLNDHSITPSDQHPDESAYAATQAVMETTQDLVLLTAPDSVQQPERNVSGSSEGTDESSPTAEATGDAAGRAMLFGRYMGQIKARIERAWEYPAASSANKFECKAQIKQNKLGEVQEITLQRCGDDPAWQLSLVQAIQQASPLSAPPDEAVFTEVVTVSFKAPYAVQDAVLRSTNATTAENGTTESLIDATPRIAGSSSDQ